MIFLVENKAIQQFIDAFCMTLLHSLWQGLLFAFIGGALLYLRSSARFKYNALLAFCLLFLGTCLLTFWWHYHYGSSLLILLTPKVTFNYDALNFFIAKILSFTTTHSKFIFILWFLCFGFCTVKTFVNIFYFDNLKNNRVVEPSKRWIERVDQLCQKLGIRSVVHMKESANIKVPIVLGHFKPVILFPIGLLASIPVEQVEAILLHELAHIRRNDYLVNLFQNIAEALFFFNPGFLLLSNWLRSQREHCCDDIAVSYTPNIKDYLLALVDFKGHVLKNNYRLAFTGNNRVLFNRVSRMLGKPYRKISSKDRSILIVSFFGLIGMGGLYFKSLVTLLSKQDKIGRTFVKQIQQSAIDPDFQIRTLFKKDHSPLKKRQVAAQIKRMSIGASKEWMVIQLPMATKVNRADEPSLQIEQRLASYQAAMEEYHNDIAQYNKTIVQYKSDLEVYNVTMEKYNLEMKEYNKIHFADKNNYPN